MTATYLKLYKNVVIGFKNSLLALISIYLFKNKFRKYFKRVLQSISHTFENVLKRCHWS